MKKKPDILIIEDNKADILLIKEAFGILNLDINFYVALNGAQGIDFFSNEKTKEIAGGLDLILLDLNIPKYNGLEVLSFIRREESFSSIPILILTSSRYETDVELSYRYKANAVIYKTNEFEEFIFLMKSIYNFWIGRGH